MAFPAQPALLVSLNEDGFFVDASDAWLRRFGYAREEITNMRPQDLSSPEGAKRIVEEYLPVLRRTGRLAECRSISSTRNNERVDCFANAIVERSEAGDYLRTIVVYTEVGAQARLEQHYRELYRATPAMLHTVDSHGRITNVSDRWLETLGYRRDEVLGRVITEFMGKETAGDARRRPLGGRDRGGRSRERAAHVRHEVRRGASRSKSRPTADRDPSGAVVALLVASKDVTARNRAERQLRAAFEENARLRGELERERDYLREEVQVSMNYGRIIGESPALKQMLVRLEAVAQTSASVLIEGESGVGKELVAHVIHARSPRSEGPLVKVNCASIPHELFESEFFGHVKGAFTGAHRDRVGRFQLADGGTIFLDEVGEIPLDLQSKLLRVLQESEYERVGDDRTHTRRRARHRGDESRSREGRRRRQLPRGPVLSLERLSDRGAAAARARRRRDPDREPFPRAHVSGVRPSAADVVEAAGRAAEALRLAGQHPRAEERHRARRDLVARQGAAARSRDERHLECAGGVRAAKRRIRASHC